MVEPSERQDPRRLVEHDRGPGRDVGVYRRPRRGRGRDLCARGQGARLDAGGHRGAAPALRRGVGALALREAAARLWILGMQPPDVAPGHATPAEAGPGADAGSAR
ncbi:MAG: hypothetical protein ACRDYA_16890 [Egibacteraceae bacterium]